MDPTTPAEGTQSAAGSEAPIGMPDISSMSESDVASLLERVNAGGQTQQTAPPVGKQTEVINPYAPKAPPTGGQADPLANVLSKFGLTPEQLVANPALQKMAQSYAEAERTLSRNFQEVSNAKKENEELRRIAGEYGQYIQQLKNQPQAPAAQSDPNKVAWTPKEVEEFNADPMGFMTKQIEERAGKIVEQKLKGVEEKSSQDRLLDNQIFMATAAARQNLPGFQGLEPEIAKILDSDFIDRNPAAIEMAYHAALGKQFPQALQFAQNKAFTEGYEKAKSEMGKAVEVGGRSSMPAMDGIDLKSIKDKTAAELEAMLPDYSNK